MGNRRRKDKRTASEQRDQQGSHEKSATSAREQGTVENRDREPFFTEGEEVPDIYLEDSATPRPSSQQRSRPRRLLRKGQQFKPVVEREVGISTSPIGFFPSVAGQEQPIKVDLANFRQVGSKSKQSKSVINFFGDLTTKEQISEYNDASSDMRGSHCTLSTTMETFCNDELTSDALDTVPQSSDSTGTRSPNGHGLMENHGSTPLAIYRRLPHSTGKPPTDGQGYGEPVRDIETTSKSEKLKSILKDMGMLPSITTDAPSVNGKAYAFSKYVRSPDPSSIPIPELRQ